MMDQKDLISAWQAVDAAPKKNTELNSIIQQRRQRVFKRMRKQLLIETLTFIVFLFVYYDFFDGDRKPIYTNMLIIVSMLLVIALNITGYMLAKRSMRGDNIKQSLNEYLSKVKLYAVLSVAGRALMAGCLLLFFTSVIKFNANKYWILAGIIAILVVQLIALSGMWLKRIGQLKGSIEELNR
jgi:hypothetical protein